MEIPPWGPSGFRRPRPEGVRYMLARDLARTVYGYENASPLKRLLARYGRKLLDFQGFDHDGQSLIRQAFSLSPKDFSSTLAIWGDLLIVGMRGDTEAAKKIMAYLLEAEEKARVSQACEAITGLSPRQLSIAENDDPIIQSLLQTRAATGGPDPVAGQANGELKNAIRREKENDER